MGLLDEKSGFDSDIPWGDYPHGLDTMELTGGNKKMAADYLNQSMRSMRYRLDKAT